MAEKSGSIARPVFFTNTLTGQREKFEPADPSRVTFYTCGPTVYSYIHIGNLRGALVADLIYRLLKKVGYPVVYVRNYTDVDDKIIKRGHEEKIPPGAVAKKYIEEVEKDFAVAGMHEPTHKTTVTGHMQEIIQMIQSILDHGKAYIAEGGEVLFSIEAFSEYGKLSHKKIEDLMAGIRVEVSEKKKNPLDFTLWKPAKPGEPSWPSPWSPGRPGWHIECSAMARKWLGDQIDLHHGGEDLVFPHHENEIAQSESATKKAPFVKIWLHHAFLTLSQEKMSKSLGNVLTARDFLTRFGGELARYFLLSSHYRSQMDFNKETLEHALSALQRIYEAKLKAEELSKKKGARADLRAENLWGGFVSRCELASQKIEEHFANDLNTPLALGELFSVIREWNRILSEPLTQATPTVALAAQQFIRLIERDIGEVLGIGRLSAEAALQDFNRIRATELRKASQNAVPSEAEILEAIQARASARKSKNFAEADAIRQRLEAAGVVLKDGPGGTTWEYT